MATHDSRPGFFGVIAHRATYRKLLYLLLSFPLGTSYFVLIVTGLSLGFGLIITLVGIPILVGVLAACYGLAAVERRLAIGLLDVEILPLPSREPTARLWDKLKALMSDPVTWKGLLYLFMKFPLGIVSFVLPVTLLATSLGLVATPFFFRWVDYSYVEPWVIDTLWEALVVAFAGFFLLFISLHVLNGLAWVSAQFARVMLGSPEERS